MAEVAGSGKAEFEIRADNLKIGEPVKSVELNESENQTITWQAEVINPDSPWVAVVIPNGNLDMKKEVIDFGKMKLSTN